MWKNCNTKYTQLAMKQPHLFLYFSFILLFILQCPFLKAQTLSGYVTDKETGEALIGATLYNPVKQTGTATNRYGFFSMKVPAGKDSITINYVGYQPETVVLVVSKDTLVNLTLSSNNYLDEVKVNGASS
jgi:hypothetical protein